jgi:mRNA interferase MazF
MEVKRGDVVLCAARGDYGKPRPAVVVQSDLFNPTHASVTIFPLTSSLEEARFFRLKLKPASSNGLKKVNQVMIDKISTLAEKRIGKVIGRISGSEVKELDAALRLWLALD